MLHNAVNDTLKKPQWTLEEVMTYYERLGRRDRSPVWTPEDMAEVDTRSFIKGLITGGILLSTVGGVGYALSQTYGGT
jgi:hypothetical protein